MERILEWEGGPTVVVTSSQIHFFKKFEGLQFESWEKLPSSPNIYVIFQVSVNEVVDPYLRCK